jgi:TP901 family phage tail tape measure protein
MAQNLTTLVTYLAGDITGLKASYTRALSLTDGYVKGVSARAGVLSNAMATLATSTLAVGAASVYAFSSFEKAMVRSTSILLDATDEQKRAMSDLALSMSTTTLTSANELAGAYLKLGSAGLNAAQQLAILPQVEMFARAGAMDLTHAITGLVDSSNALGYSMNSTNQIMAATSRVSDVLVKANTIANASVSEFATALSRRAAAAMRVFNIEVEEGTAVLAAYAKTGIKGSMAGRMFDIFVRQITDKAVKNADAFKYYNVQVYDSQGKLLKLSSIVKSLTTALNGLSDEQKTVALSQMGLSGRTQQAIKMLLGMNNQIDIFEEQLKSAGGTTKKIADDQLKTFSASVTQAWNALKLLSIELGELITEMGVKSVFDTMGSSIRHAAKELGHFKDILFAITKKTEYGDTDIGKFMREAHEQNKGSSTYGDDEIRNKRIKELKSLVSLEAAGDLVKMLRGADFSLEVLKAMQEAEKLDYVNKAQLQYLEILKKLKAEGADTSKMYQLPKSATIDESLAGFQRLTDAIQAAQHKLIALREESKKDIAPVAIKAWDKDIAELAKLQYEKKPTAYKLEKLGLDIANLTTKTFSAQPGTQQRVQGEILLIKKQAERNNLEMEIRKERKKAQDAETAILRKNIRLANHAFSNDLRVAKEKLQLQDQFRSRAEQIAVREIQVRRLLKGIKGAETEEIRSKLTKEAMDLQGQISSMRMDKTNMMTPPEALIAGSVEAANKAARMDAQRQGLKDWGKVQFEEQKKTNDLLKQIKDLSSNPVKLVLNSINQDL